jgi:hypothetical protein
MVRHVSPASLWLPAVLLIQGAPASDEVHPPHAVTFDFVSIPTPASEMELQLGACKVSLAQAAETAAKDAGGTAGSIQVGGPKGAPVYEVVVYGKGQAQRVLVDAVSGAVKSKAEMQRFPGDPTKSDWVETPSGLRYFELRSGSGDKPPTGIQIQPKATLVFDVELVEILK